MHLTSSFIFTFSSLLALSTANSVRFYYQIEGLCEKAFIGCEHLDSRQCCVAGDTPGFSVSISHNSGDTAVGWYQRNPGHPCEDAACLYSGSGTACCTGGQPPRYTGGSWYGFERGRYPGMEVCTSKAQVNIFGWTLNDGKGQFLQISSANNTDFETLRAAFKQVAPGQEQAWLQQNGAVMITDKPTSSPMVLWKAPFKA